MRSKSSSLILLTAATALVLSGEFIDGRLTPPQQAILTSTRSLIVKLETDRAEYLPGEIAVVKITVTNPKSEAMQVLQPFDGRSGGLDMLQWNEVNGGGYSPCWRDAHRTRPINWDAPLAWIPAAASLETKVSTLDQSAAWADFARSDLSVGRAPGEYAAEYTLVPGSMVKFRVLPAIVEEVKLGKLPMVVGKQGIAVRPEVRAALIRSGDRRFVVVSHSARTDTPSPMAHPERPATSEEIRDFNPLVRIAEVPDGTHIQEVICTENTRVHLRWLEPGGKLHSLVLDENRRVVPQNE